MADNPEQIAASLSEAQRRVIMRTYEHLGLTWFLTGSARGIPEDLKQRTIYGHYLTPLGLQVRALLAERNSDGR